MTTRAVVLPIPAGGYAVRCPLGWFGREVYSTHVDLCDAELQAFRLNFSHGTALT